MNAARAHSPTAMWSGWPVSPSGANVRTVRGLDHPQHERQPRRRLVRVEVGQPAVGQVEPEVVVDAEDGEGLLELTGAEVAQVRRRELTAVLAAASP